MLVHPDGWTLIWVFLVLWFFWFFFLSPRCYAHSALWSCREAAVSPGSWLQQDGIVSPVQLGTSPPAPPAAKPLRVHPLSASPCLLHASAETPGDCCYS